MSKRKGKFGGRLTATDGPSAATNQRLAKRHHSQHGDMDGRVCLLTLCALHYPKRRPTR